MNAVDPHALVGKPTPAGANRRDEAPDLDRSILSANRMLAFSARKGIKLKDDDIAAVIAAQRLGKSLSDEQERKFWSSYSDIALAVLPATPESIDSSLIEKNASPAMKTASQYRYRTIVTLGLLLIFQIYWLVGATIVTDLKDIRAKLEQLEIDRQKGLEGQRALPAESDTSYKERKAVVDAEATAFEDRLWIDRISAATDFEVLSNWNFFKMVLLWRDTRVPPPPTTANAADADDMNLKPSDHFLWVFTQQNVIELQTSQIVLTSLIKYILPILYGSLGASAYIVRLLADEIFLNTYTTNTYVRYQLRFYLGAVAGFSIAWFTSASTAESAGILQSLSPLALAFLAGYSVDLLFSLLDRLVSAFSDAGPRRGQVPAGRSA